MKQKAFYITSQGLSFDEKKNNSGHKALILYLKTCCPGEKYELEPYMSKLSL